MPAASLDKFLSFSQNTTKDAPKGTVNSAAIAAMLAAESYISVGNPLKLLKSCTCQSTAIVRNHHKKSVKFGGYSLQFARSSRATRNTQQQLVG